MITRSKTGVKVERRRDVKGWQDMILLSFSPLLSLSLPSSLARSDSEGLCSQFLLLYLFASCGVLRYGALDFPSSLCSSLVSRRKRQFAGPNPPIPLPAGLQVVGSSVRRDRISKSFVQESVETRRGGVLAPRKRDGRRTALGWACSRVSNPISRSGRGRSLSGASKSLKDGDPRPSRRSRLSRRISTAV